MAEVVGVVSAGIGVAAFIVQITGNISRLKEIRDYNQHKAGDEIEFLVRRLEFLQNVLVPLQSYEGNPVVDIAIKNCQLEYSRVDDILQRVAETIYRAQAERSKKWKTLVKPPEIKKDLNIAKERITGVIADLTCSFTLVLHQTIPSQTPAKGAHSSGCITETESTDEGEQSNAVAITKPAESNLGTTTDMTKIIRPIRRQPCSVRHCHCSCHTTGSSSGRFWGFQYTPFSSIWRYCDNAQCSARRYRWNLRIALTQYGIPLTVITGFELISGEGNYSLRPALSVQRTVRYTSPGFETLECFHHGLLDAEDVKRKFLELYRADPSLKNHVNPAGRDYVQELLPPTILKPDMRMRLQLLDFFISELGMSLENQGLNFLMECVLSLYVPSIRVPLLDAVLKHGFDPDGADSPVFENWPGLHYHYFRDFYGSRDPFYVKSLVILANNDTGAGFGGLTPLHQAVLQRSVQTVVSLVSRPTAAANEKNLLGQTPIHLATPSLELISLLYEGGHDIDAQDKWGATPLIYAGALGNTEAVQFFISHGANISITDNEGTSFLVYACRLGHWDLVLDALGTIRPHCSPEDFQQYIHTSLTELEWLGRYPGETRAHFIALVELCGNVDDVLFDYHLTGTENNNLLHYVSSCEEAEALVRCGFTGFNQPNSAGETPIFSLAQYLDTRLFRFLLDRGANINHVGSNRQSILFRLMSRLQSFGGNRWNAMDLINICVSEKAGIFSSDNCMCSCSPGGCSVSSIFDVSFGDPPWSPMPSVPFVWGLEFLSLVEERRGLEESQKVLLSLLRTTWAQKIGITHICCHKGAHKFSSFVPDDALKIPDEEEELIEELNNKMCAFASDSFETLRTKWMLLLREVFDDRLKAFKESLNRPSRPRLEVDYKNDKFVRHYDIRQPGPSLLTPTAEYLIWMEHEYVRRKTKTTNRERKAWYAKRLLWIMELMQIMNLNGDEIVSAMQEQLDFWEDELPEDLDRKRVINHFMDSVQAVDSNGVK